MKIGLGYDVIDGGESIAKAVKKMYIQGVDHLLVYQDRDKTIGGIVSVKDIARGFLGEFELAGDIEHFSIQLFFERPVIDVASKPVIAFGDDPGLPAALKTMCEKNIGIVPVISSEGELLNVYTELDAAILLVKIGVEVSALSRVTWNLVSGNPEMPLVEALGFMIERDFRHLPFFSDGYVFMASMPGILHYLGVIRETRALLHPLEAVGHRALVVDSSTASFALISELILSLTEKAVIVKDRERYGIITIRDLVCAASDITSKYGKEA